MASLNDNLQIILNKTEGYYFIYHGDHTQILKNLFKTDASGYSRWNSEDKIVFVPHHLREFVTRNYENIFF